MLAQIAWLMAKFMGDKDSTIQTFLFDPDNEEEPVEDSAVVESLKQVFGFKPRTSKAED